MPRIDESGPEDVELADATGRVAVNRDHANYTGVWRRAGAFDHLTPDETLLWVLGQRAYPLSGEDRWLIEDRPTATVSISKAGLNPAGPRFVRNPTNDLTSELEAILRACPHGRCRRDRGRKDRRPFTRLTLVLRSKSVLGGPGPAAPA
jgi:hypothetical protein